MSDNVEVMISSPVVPVYAHPGDAGADLMAAEAFVLTPGARATVPTGVSIGTVTAMSRSSFPEAGWRPSTASRSSTAQAQWMPATAARFA